MFWSILEYFNKRIPDAFYVTRNFFRRLDSKLAVKCKCNCLVSCLVRSWNRFITIKSALSVRGPQLFSWTVFVDCVLYIPRIPSYQFGQRIVSFISFKAHSTILIYSFIFKFTMKTQITKRITKFNMKKMSEYKLLSKWS